MKTKERKKVRNFYEYFYIVKCYNCNLITKRKKKRKRRRKKKEKEENRREEREKK